MVSFSQFLLAVNTLAVILRNESTRHETIHKWIEVSILACRILTLAWVGICLWNLLSQAPEPTSSTSSSQTQDNYKGIKIIVFVVLGLLNLVSLLFSILVLCFLKTRGPRVLKLMYTDLGIALVVWFMFILVVLLLTTNGTKPAKGKKQSISTSKTGSPVTSTGTRTISPTSVITSSTGNKSTDQYGNNIRVYMKDGKQIKEIKNKQGKVILQYWDDQRGKRVREYTNLGKKILHYVGGDGQDVFQYQSP